MQYRDYPIRVPGTDLPCKLTFYGHDLNEPVDPERRFPAILICPGGGYRYTSRREAEPVARVFLARGFNVFVLRYLCAPEAHWPIPQLEAAEAMRLIRGCADETMTDPGRVFICGFSAGGHLAASLGVLWKRSDWAEKLGAAAETIRPDGMILCYPVITSGEKAHRGSIENLLGPEKLTEEMKNAVSLEKQVREDAVPAFIWHTRDDGSVPVENSLLMAGALADRGIPFELHVFPKGSHGLSLANDLTDTSGGSQTLRDCAMWPDLAASWMLEEKWNV